MTRKKPACVRNPSGLGQDRPPCPLHDDDQGNYCWNRRTNPDWTPQECLGFYQELCRRDHRKERRDKTWDTHFHENYQKLYGERCEVVQEMTNERARVEWDGYRVLPDGREGPTPESVATPARRSEYCRRFGFKEI